MASALLLILLQDPAALIDRLNSDDPGERDAATRALIDLGPMAVDIVKPLLESDDLEVSARARAIVRALTTHDDPRMSVCSTNLQAEFDLYFELMESLEPPGEPEIIEAQDIIYYPIKR